MSRINSLEQVYVYVDELKEYRNKLGEKWTYIGALHVPARHHRHAQEQLRSDRQAVGYDQELHFTELRNFSFASEHNSKSALAKKWVERVISDRDKTYHYALLGINLHNLTKNAFGNKSKVRRVAIYNRFLRSLILFSSQYFFPGQGVEIVRLFHDESELQHVNWVKTHLIDQINNSSSPVHFPTTYRIQFINSDHNKERHFPRDSHFVQLCDILTGAVTQVLDDRTAKDGCRELAGYVYPIVKSLTCSSSRCPQNMKPEQVNRFHISFFPSGKLTGNQLADAQTARRSNFYEKRPLLWKPDEDC